MEVILKRITNVKKKNYYTKNIYSCLIHPTNRYLKLTIVPFGKKTPPEQLSQLVKPTWECLESSVTEIIINKVLAN